MPEADLYAPVKRFLEKQGYSVKGEVGACDIVAVRDDEPPVVVELKDRLNLALLLQAVDRLRVSESVYLAFRVGKSHSATWRTRRKHVIQLLRRLGLGLLTVSTRDRVEAVLDPAPYQPRASAPRRARLLKEFHERVGDPEEGGSPSKQRVTAYRQDALRCAIALATVEELPVKRLRALTEVARAGRILLDNHYGWFERVRTGHYALTPRGREDLGRWAEAVRVIETTMDLAELSSS